MTPDPEIERWRADWQSSGEIPPDLRRRVERHVRAQRHAWWPPIVVTLVMGGGTLGWAITSGDRAAIQVATATWLFIAVTWATSLGILRYFGGRRRPEAVTTTSFIDFAVRVCRGTRAGIVAAAVLYMLFLGFMLFWRFQTGPFETAGEFVLSSRVVSMALVTVLLGAVAWRWHRRLSVELESLLATQRQFIDAPGDQTRRDD